MGDQQGRGVEMEGWGKDAYEACPVAAFVVGLELVAEVVIVVLALAGHPALDAVAR